MRDEYIKRTKTGNYKYPEAETCERPVGAEVEQPYIRSRWYKSW